MPKITPLGRRWELLHSFWLLCLLAIYRDGNLTFLAFFYIGIRARRWKWIVAGIGYFIVVLAFFLVKVLDYVDHFIFDITLWFMLTFYLISWLHAFWARREYLQIIAERKLTRDRQTLKQEKEKIRDQKVQQAIAVGKQQHNVTTSKNNKPVYINTATKKDVAKITGEALAKEIVKARKKHGKFLSVIDLIRVVHIKPHVLVKIKNYFIFTADIPKEPKDLVTKSNNKRGRIVDY